MIHGYFSIFSNLVKQMKKQVYEVKQQKMCFGDDN